MTDRRRRLLLLGILAVALAVRLAHFAAVRDEPFVRDLVLDSKEYDAWARGIAEGDWLGSRVFFQAPLYPYLLATVYRTAGHRLDVVYLLQIAAAVAGIAALYAAGRRMGGERVGLVAAALAALYGPFVFHDVQILKESLAVTVACFLLLALVRAREGERVLPWLGAGLLLGVLILLRESALLVAPFLLLLAFRRGVPRRAVLTSMAVFLLGIVLPMVPVAIRNGIVGGDFLPTTSQGGANFFIGNNPEADGTYRPIVPGKQIPSFERSESTRVAEQEVGRALSPAEVSSYWLGKALSWAREDPLAFAALQLRKLGLYWSWYEWPDAVDYAWMKTRSPVFRVPLVEFGAVSLLSVLGLGVLWRRRLFARFAPAWLFALAWMLSTVAFFLFSRYRLPGIPTHLVLAALPIVALDDARRAGSRKWPWGAALLLAMFLLPLAPGAGPRHDLVEFNLGRLAEERGDLAAAEGHYRAALAADPDHFLANLNLGALAAGRRDWPEALVRFRRAVALQPNSDDAHANLGGVLLATGRLDEAATHLDRALSLNPGHAAARRNREVLSRLGD